MAVINSLSRFIDGDAWQLKERLRYRISNNELFKLREGLSLNEYRKVTHERVRFLLTCPELVQQFEDEATNERNFINNSMALGEIISSVDCSVGVKAGVLGWLFGGAVKNLGSSEHLDKYFQPLKTGAFTGMFAMTEQAHGTNVRGIETSAHYDVNTQEFVIHTPSAEARKLYIGNALHGEYAAVFAQLYIEGQCKGPHCFIVPMRDSTGQLLPGIEVIDMGHKEGLNGVDNGVISFHHVRIPRENLLNRYADVAIAGKYVTDIANDGARFNVMLSALLGCRISLSLQAVSAMKVGLDIAIRYGLRRRQFGPRGEREQLILDYQTHQLRLMPCLAACLALVFATRHAGMMLNDDVHCGRSVLEDRELQALAGGLKAYSTWQALDTLQVCRECTGGMGFMEVNRISTLKRDADAFVTFEGDNTVMLQQVAKELLAQYAQWFGGNRVLAGAVGAAQAVYSAVRTSVFAVGLEPVTSVTFVLKALAFKESELLRTLAARLLNKVSFQHEEPFLAWNDCLDHVTNLGMTHVHRLTLEKFSEAVKTCPYVDDRAIMQKFCELYAIHLLYTDKGWYLESRFISSSASRELRDKHLSMCAQTRTHALQVVEAFRHSPSVLHAPIAGVPPADPRDDWAYFPDSMMEEGQRAPKAKL